MLLKQWTDLLSAPSPQAKQQQHERDLYELKIKAEREALEAQLQLEENRQRMARVLHSSSLSPARHICICR